MHSELKKNSKQKNQVPDCCNMCGFTSLRLVNRLTLMEEKRKAQKEKKCVP